MVRNPLALYSLVGDRSPHLDLGSVQGSRVDFASFHVRLTRTNHQSGSSFASLKAK